MVFRGAIILVLLAGVIAAARAPLPSTGTIIASSAEVFDRPDEVGFVVAELPKGAKVEIDHEMSGGWIAIAPPAGVFCWVDEKGLDRKGPGAARVVVTGTTPRSANRSARLPGLPRAPLKGGTHVTLLDLPPCVVPQRGGARVFRAIEPPVGQLYYVDARDIRVAAGRAGKLRAPAATIPPLPIDVSIATPGNSIRPATLPPALLAELSRVDAAHRAVLRGTIDTWNLDAVKRGYEDLANRYQDPDSRALIEGRIARVVQQNELARQSRRFEMLVRESRQRDASKVLKKPALTDENLAFDAVGMLQRSTKLYEGQRVFALIGDDGTTTAYLSVPPGILTDRYLSNQVGVRGQVRYDAKFRNRVIVVEDLSSLRAAP